MGNVGRFFCVALPFILTAASIICMLVVGLTGVTSNASLYIFRANVTGLTISPASVETLLSLSSRDAAYLDKRQGGGFGASGSSSGSSGTPTEGSASTGTSGSAASASTTTTTTTTLTSNITATDLTLKDLYDINLWGYCTTDDNGDRACSKAAFDWAESALNTSYITNSGYNISLPSEVTSSLSAFKKVTKWTEVVYIIAMIALAVELLAGTFTYCSRAVSCITYLVSGIATVAVCATAAMITAMAVIVVGAIEGTAKYYGVSGSINTSFLAAVWLGAAFAIAASLFWLFSACCCKRDHHTRRSKNVDDEKPFLPAGSYAPLHDNHNNNNNNNHNGSGHVYNQQPYGYHNNARSDLAYEPYSHSRV